MRDAPRHGQGMRQDAGMCQVGAFLLPAALLLLLPGTLGLLQGTEQRRRIPRRPSHPIQLPTPLINKQLTPGSSWSHLQQAG